MRVFGFYFDLLFGFFSHAGENGIIRKQKVVQTHRWIMWNWMVYLLTSTREEALFPRDSFRRWPFFGQIIQDFKIMMIFKEWGRQRKAVICKWLHISSSETKREAQYVEQGKYTYFVGGRERMIYMYENKENWDSFLGQIRAGILYLRIS